MKKILKPVISIAVLIILTISGLMIFKNTNTVKDAETKDVSKINIALVDEDAGSIYNKKFYNIGKNYVDNASQDKKYNWSIVSRAVAENGLNSGDYNLLIVIPSDFSQNILSINDKSPKSEGLTYKVNGKGNKNLESRTKNAGEKIISQLDKKLTNVYMASILTNLYTAQQNVQKVVDNQGEHVLGLNDRVVDPLSTHQSSINDLTNQTSDITGIMGDFTDTLKAFIDNTNNNSESNSSFSDDLNALIRGKHDNDINYADFINQMMKLNNSVIDKDTNNLYSAVSGNREIFNDLFNKDNGKFNNDINNLENEVSQNTIELNDINTKLTNNILNPENDSINYLDDYFGSENEFNNLTVDDFLNKFSGDTNGEQNKKDKLNKIIFNFNNNNTKLIPRNSSEVYQIKNELSLLNDRDFINISSSSATVEQLANNSSISGIIFDTTDSWKKDVIDSYNILKPLLNTEFVQNISIDSDINTIQKPASLVIDNIYLGNKQIPFKSNGNEVNFDIAINDNFTIKYHINSGKLSSNSSYDNWTLLNNGKKESDINVDYSGMTQQIGNAISNYQRSVTKLNDEFNDANLSLNLLKSLGDGYDVGDTKISDYLITLLSNFNEEQTTQVKGYLGRTNLINIVMNSYTVPKLIDDDKKTIAESEKLNTNINEQLSLLNQWQSQFSVINSSGDTFSQNNQKLSTNLDEKDDTFKGLLDSSNSINDSAKQNAESSDEIAKTIDSYHSAINNAKNDGDKLVENTKTVKGQFDIANTDDHEFSKQFNGVLANANPNGATNDKLLGFLVSPVKASSKATIQQANINVPYKIILVMFIMAIASTLIIDKINIASKNKNGIKEASYYVNNIPKTIANLVLSIIMGFLASLIIQKAYGITIEATLPLYAFFIGYQILFGLFNHMMLKILKMYGIGISLLMVVIFSLTSDLGLDIQTMSISQKIIFEINPMNSMQRVMTTFFTQSTNIWVQMVEVLIISILIFIFTIFMNNPKWNYFQKRVNIHE